MNDRVGGRAGKGIMSLGQISSSYLDLEGIMLAMG